MKIPDKIYISIERTYGASDGQVIAMVTPHNERQSVNDVEYIRKDALLEWVKDLKHMYEIQVNNHQASKICRVKAEAFQLVIDKLNSM